VLGLQSGNKTRGHRFMGKSDITSQRGRLREKLLDEARFSPISSKRNQR
jgi:glycyl-tRNA synthetase beta subunit